MNIKAAVEDDKRWSKEREKENNRLRRCKREEKLKNKVRAVSKNAATRPVSPGPADGHANTMPRTKISSRVYVSSGATVRCSEGLMNVTPRLAAPMV